MRCITIPIASVTLLCCLTAGFGHAAPEDDWDLFADTRSHSLGLRVGDADALSWGVDLALMLPGQTEFSIDYLQGELEVFGSDERLTNVAAQFSSDPLATWSAQLLYERSGDRDSLLTEDVGVGVQYSAGHWLLGVRYLLGEVDLRTAPIAPQQTPRGFSMDRDAWAVQFAIFGEQWVWSVDYQDYGYERSIRLNPNSLLLLRRLGLNTFQQVFGLLDWTAAMEFGYQCAQHSWRLGYSQQALELTNESGRIPYAGWDYTFSEQLSAGVLGAVGLGDAEHYAELSLRVRF